MAPRLIAVALGALALAAPATAAETPIIDRAANAARGRSVYVHPDTNLVTATEARRLERQIEREAHGPLYIAILPAAARREAGGTATGVVLELNRRIVTTNPPAVHAVVVGNEFRAVNRDIPAGDLATEAFQAHRAEGVYAVLSDFVRRVGKARTAPAQPVEPPGDGGSNTWIVAVFGAIVALVAVGALRRRRRRATDLREVKSTAKEDLVALADDISELDAEVDRRPEAKAAYVRAMEAYQRADDAFDRARSPRDVSKVTSALADARYEMEGAKALLAGQEPPERRPPCFFDPRHGLSVRDVSWVSPRGDTIRVPACAADAARVEAGEAPEARQVLVGGRRRPFWDSTSHEPWASGFFGGAAAGVFVSSALASDEADAATPVSDSSEVGGGDFGGDLGGGGDFGGDGGGGGDF
jgi:MYXO-CTERM domain-containing protein